MKIIELSVKNFMSIGDIQIHLDSPGLNLILGHNVDDKRFDSNGAAKSALFEALVWCLYGQLMRPLTQDEIIRTGTHAVTVCAYIDPEDGSEPVVIQRKRIRGKSHEVNVATKSGTYLFPSASVKDIQQQIDSWLGLDYRTFTNSVYFGKGLVKFFMSASDNDRKELLETILQLVSFDSALENAKAMVKQASEDIKEAEKQIGIGEALISEKKATLDLYQDSFKVVKKQKEVELPELIQLLTANLKARDEKNEVITAINSEINEINKAYNDKLLEHNSSLEIKGKVIKTNAEIKAKLETDLGEEEIETLTGAYNTLIKSEVDAKQLLIDKSKAITNIYMMKFADLSNINKDKKAIGEKIERTEALGVFCNSCGQGISSGYKDEVIAKLNENLIELQVMETDKERELEKLSEENKEITTKLETASKCIEAHNKKLNDTVLEVRGRINKNIMKINKEATELVIEEVKEASKLKELWEKENKEVVEYKWALRTALTKEIGEWNLNIQQMEATKMAIETTYDNCLNNIQTLVGDIKKFEDSIKNREEEKKKHIKTKDISEFWVEGFGSKGIKSFIFESALPFLTERANKYSTYLTGGTVLVDILPTTMVKSTGNSKEKLFIQAKNKIGANVYDGNSDGEKRRIDICILLALQDLISTRATKVWNTIIFDEVMDALDKTGTEHVIDLFRQFTGKSIYIISHSSDLKSHFDTSITIKKEHGVSSI